MPESEVQTIVINGKFLSRNVTGVQRYAREILKEMDKLVCKNSRVILAADKNAKDVPRFENITVEKVGILTGNLWEQISLPLFVLRKRALCVSLCNMTPILTPHIVVIHDVSFKVNKTFFSKKFAAWYNFVFSLSIRRIRQIITVSEFSAGEISREYKIDKKKITVTYIGWQHFERISAGNSALKKYGLESKKYFFAMSSMAPNKNFKWIAKAAEHAPEEVFAVGGEVNKKVFGDIFNFEIPENLRFLGYVSDSEAKELMRECRAFLFPTFYEGFGIPVLEALSVGAKAVVSDKSCMREIYGNSVYYIDPNNYNMRLEEVLKHSVESPERLLDKYNWKKSAEILWNVIKSVLK